MKTLHRIFYLAALVFVIASCQPKQQANSDDAQDLRATTKADYNYQLKLSDNSMSYPFQQKELGYAYNGLEPSIDAQTMELHYSKHHAGYTSKFNKAVEENNLGAMKLFDIFQNISQYPSSVRNNGGGFYNHLLFWQIMAPNAGGEPTGELASAIDATFGGFESFKGMFNDAAKTVFGSGWAWLSVDANGKLFISQTSNQDNPLMDIVDRRGIPVMCLDVWEHAYYLKYQNKRPDYIGLFWSVINWPEVERRYAEAMTAVS